MDPAPCDCEGGLPVACSDLTIPTGAVVPHPAGAGLPDTINGILCQSDGLVAPRPGFPAIASDGNGAGTMPAIVADTTGQDTWGPVLTTTLTNPNSDRAMYGWATAMWPHVTVVIQPGATVTIGEIIDPLGLAVYAEMWSMTNNGLVNIEHSFFIRTLIHSFILLPSGVFTSDQQMWIETSGFTGASSVATQLGNGVSVEVIGVPV